MREMTNRGLKIGILFGPERTGLENEDFVQTDYWIRYPLDPRFMSLNLSQAVMIMAYEWWMSTEETPERQLQTNKTHIATKGELNNFMNHLIRELDHCGFLRNQEKRPGMIRNLYHLFQRGEVTEQELRTLHGVVAELVKGPMK